MGKHKICCLLYCDIHFLGVVWTQTHIISEEFLYLHHLFIKESIF